MRIFLLFYFLFTASVQASDCQRALGLVYEPYVQVLVDEGYSRDESIERVQKALERFRAAFNSANGQSLVDTATPQSLGRLNGELFTLMDSSGGEFALGLAAVAEGEVKGLDVNTVLNGVSRRARKAAEGSLYIDYEPEYQEFFRNFLRLMGAFREKVWLKTVVEMVRTASHLEIQSDHDYSAIAYPSYIDQLFIYYPEGYATYSKLIDHVIDGGFLTQVLATVPFHQLSKQQQDFLQAWFGLTGREKTTDSISSIHSVKRCPGECPIMTHGHMAAIVHRYSSPRWTFDLNEYGVDKEEISSGAVSLVFLQGQLVGSLKHAIHGDDSMLALRTLRDSEGRYPLVLGATYALPLSLRERMSDRPWDEIHLDELPLMPLSFLENYQYPSEVNFGSLQKAIVQARESILRRRKLGTLKK